jgi:hypothetical protein
MLGISLEQLNHGRELLIIQYQVNMYLHPEMELHLMQRCHWSISMDIDVTMPGII